MGNSSAAMKPILLYDHLPGILAGYPAALFAILALLSLPYEHYEKKLGSKIENQKVAASTADAEQADAPVAKAQIPGWVPNPHMLYWVGLSIMIVWYIAFQFNIPKSKFWLLFGLLGTFVGIPVVLEIFGVIRPFTTMAHVLQGLAPKVNAGGFFVFALVFTIIWLVHFIWSRTHMKVVIDESGLTISQLGGKEQRFELIGLKTETEPLDYLEMFVAGIGSLSLKTRMNKPIFEMNRVVGLYWAPWLPFSKGKLARIEEMLSFQGKVVSVEAHEANDLVEQMDAESEESAAAGGEEEYGDDSSTSDRSEFR